MGFHVTLLPTSSNVKDPRNKQANRRAHRHLGEYLIHLRAPRAHQKTRHMYFIFHSFSNMTRKITLILELTSISKD